MNSIKSFTSRAAFFVATISFFLFANIVILFSVINAENLKETAKTEDVYGKFIPAMLSSIKVFQTSIGNLPLNKPWVQEAAVKAFPASDVEQKTGQVIDGNFNWLEGKTEKPEFQLDFTQNKQALATELGNNTGSRLASLPKCAPGVLPDISDLYRISCLPLGLSPQLIASRATSEVQNSQEFLGNPVINYEALSQEASKNNQPDPTKSLEGLRSLYQNKSFFEFFLPIIAVVLAAVSVFVASDRSKAFVRLYRSFFSFAGPFLVLFLILRFGINPLVEKAAVGQPLTRDVISPVFTSLLAQATNYHLIFAGICLVIGLVGLAINKRLLR